MAPWIFILFMAIFDFGFYSYAMIATENAARVAALVLSGSPGESGTPAGDAARKKRACHQAQNELRMLPNFNSFDVGSGGNDCTSGPLVITTTEILAGDPESADGERAIKVAVTYQTIPLFPIPAVTNQLTITRTVQIRTER